MSKITHLSVYVKEDPISVARQAAETLEKLYIKSVSEKGVFNLAISGGSTPIPLFRLLADPEWSDRFAWEKVNIYWVDERCVPPESPDSNYGVARKELLSFIPATRFYRIKGELKPFEAAANYEELLVKNFNLKDGELPRFDCMVLGMGADGHVASLFPDIADYIDTQYRVIDIYVPRLRQSRITFTLPVINNSKACIFLVSGREKHPAVSRALNLLTSPDLPAQKVRPDKGELIWILDEAAAQG
ncbi:MAG: 6-phosphogluconolactonase [Desulfovibrionaceae bacterium]|nr:6-phosphogluconolactonase [Desulfovibrionaceae bacterium]